MSGFFLAVIGITSPSRGPTGCDARVSDAEQMDNACSDLPSRIRNHLRESPARYPDTKSPSRRQRRHCSQVCRPRFPHLAPSHIPQATDPKLLFRTRTPTQNTFGEAFGEARAATVESGFASKTARLRDQLPLLQKKKNLGARATYLR